MSAAGNIMAMSKEDWQKAQRHVPIMSYSDGIGWHEETEEEHQKRIRDAGRPPKPWPFHGVADGE